MKTLIIIVCLALAACEQNSGDVTSVHDTKYSTVAIGTDICVLDAQTQLLWQTKTLTMGLNNSANTYSWFDPDERNGELDYRGLEDGGDCTGSACDTWHYTQAVNEAGFCGHNDWRMPSKNELFSISELRRAATPPTINTEFFPNTKAAEYWSGNDYSFQYNTAWAWNFELGHDRVDWKKEAKLVRLVRGTAAALESVKE